MDLTEAIEEHDHNRELRKDYRKHLHVLERQSAKLGVHTPPHIQIEIDEIKRKIQICERKINTANLIIERLSMIKELDRIMEFYQLALNEPNITDSKLERTKLNIRGLNEQTNKLRQEADSFIKTYIELD